MLIYDSVKNFIYDNKDVINSEDWYRLFESWYNVSNYQQHEEFQQLMHILEKSNLTTYRETEHVRSQIIVKHMFDYIMSQQILNKDIVTMVGTFNSLRSRLGFTLPETRDLFVKTCLAKGLEPTSGDLLRFKL